MSVPLLTIKSALKIDYDEDDRELTRIREAATSLVERKTQIGLTVREHTLYLREFADTLIPVHPFVSVASVKYTTSGVLTTVASTEYWIDRTEPMPVLRFLSSFVPDRGTMVEVRYSAGYAEIPNELAHAIVSLVGHWYNNPEAASPIGLTTIPLGLEYILQHVSTGSMMR